MDLPLSPVETRVLGCLIEKEMAIPEYYPLTLNALKAACNQLTNREPVAGYDEKTVVGGLDGLREKKLATMIMTAGSRAPKYRHAFLDIYNVSRPEMALLCVLLLRGPQTLGELRTRTERLAGFASLGEAEAALESLTLGEQPLVRVIPARSGQKEKRYAQLLSGEPETAPLQAGIKLEPATVEYHQEKSRFEAIEKELAETKAALLSLREEFAAFRKQFE